MSVSSDNLFNSLNVTRNRSGQAEVINFGSELSLLFRAMGGDAKDISKEKFLENYQKFGISEKNKDVILGFFGNDDRLSKLEFNQARTKIVKGSAAPNLFGTGRAYFSKVFDGAVSADALAMIEAAKSTKDVIKTNAAPLVSGSKLTLAKTNVESFIKGATVEAQTLNTEKLADFLDIKLESENPSFALSFYKGQLVKNGMEEISGQLTLKDGKLSFSDFKDQLVLLARANVEKSRPDIVSKDLTDAQALLLSGVFSLATPLPVNVSANVIRQAVQTKRLQSIQKSARPTSIQKRMPVNIKARASKLGKLSAKADVSPSQTFTDKYFAKWDQSQGVVYNTAATIHNVALVTSPAYMLYNYFYPINEK